METRLTKSNTEQRLETAKIIFDYLPNNNVFKVNETKETMSAKAVAYNGVAALIEEYVATKYNTKRHTKLNEQGTDLLNGMEVKYSSTHHFIKNAKIASKLSIDGLKNKMKATKIVAVVYDDINNELLEFTFPPYEGMDAIYSFKKLYKLDPNPIKLG